MRSLFYTALKENTNQPSIPGLISFSVLAKIYFQMNFCLSTTSLYLGMRRKISFTTLHVNSLYIDF